MHKITKPFYTEFMQHKHNSKRRNVEFHLNYDEWYKIWNDSGKLHLRGKRQGCFVMSRNGDIGPYSVDNVTIKPIKENVEEAHNGNQYNTGRIHSKETRQKVSQTSMYRSAGSKHVLAKLTDEQVLEIRILFASGLTNKDLAEQFNVSRATISRIIHRKSWIYI